MAKEEEGLFGARKHLEGQKKRKHTARKKRETHRPGPVERKLIRDREAAKHATLDSGLSN